MDSSSNFDVGSTEDQSRASNYHVMVLRLWREHPGAAWRLTMQEVGQAGRHSFPDLDSLMAHLVRLMTAAPAQMRRDPRRLKGLDEVDDADSANEGG
jgi:hypothetical protein